MEPFTVKVWASYYGSICLVFYSCCSVVKTNTMVSFFMLFVDRKMTLCHGSSKQSLKLKEGRDKHFHYSLKPTDKALWC